MSSNVDPGQRRYCVARDRGRRFGAVSAVRGEGWVRWVVGVCPPTSPTSTYGGSSTRKLRGLLRVVAWVVGIAALALNSGVSETPPAIQLYDLNRAPPESSTLPEIARASEPIDGRVLLTICTRADGCELWSYDGASSRLEQLRDLRSGAEGSFPQCFIAAGPMVFFTAAPSRFVGSNTWFSDGTSHRTFSVGPAVVTEGPVSFGECPGGSPRDGLVTSPMFLDGIAGLWSVRSEGSRELVRPFAPGTDYLPPSEDPRWLAVGGRLFFTLCTGAEGCEPWVSDGTAEGTHLVADLAPGNLSSDASSYASYAGRVIFQAQLPSEEPSLWMMDPGKLSVHRLDWVPADGVARAKGWTAASRNRLFWVLFPLLGPPELWTFDGTSVQRLLPALEAGAHSYEDLGGLAAIESGLFFWVRDDTGTHPWFSSGQAEETAQLTEAWIEVLGDPRKPPFHRAGDRVGFSGWRAGEGYEPWVSDGTPDGTTLVADLVPGPEHSSPESWFALGKDLLFWTAPPGSRLKLWRISGNQYRLAAELGPRSEDSGAIPMGVRGDLALATASLPWNGARLIGVQLDEPWGTETLIDLAYPQQQYDIRPSGELVQRHWFEVRRRLDEGLDVWRSDGTSAGTELVATLGSAPASESLLESTEGTSLQGRVPGGFLIRHTSSETGMEPWLLTPAGSISLLRDIREGPEDGWLLSTGAVASGFAGGALFGGYDFDAGWEPWFTDGTPGGTVLADDVYPGPLGCLPRRFAGLSDAMLFTGSAASGPPAPRYLYLLRAGKPAAVAVAQQTPQAHWEAYPHKTASSGDEVGFFVQMEPDHFELWLSDGTLERTRPIVPHFGDPAYVTLNELAHFRGRWYFVDADPEHGRELWVTDGSPDGERLLFDLYPGAASSEPRELTAGASGVYFVAQHPEHGRELWRTDGIGPPLLIADLNPGVGGTAPAALRYERGVLCWNAISPELGRELLCLRDPKGGDSIFVVDFETGDLLDWELAPER